MSTSLEELRRCADEPHTINDPWSLEAERGEHLATVGRILDKTRGRDRQASEQRLLDQASMAVELIDTALRKHEIEARRPGNERAAQAEQLRAGLSRFGVGGDSAARTADRFGDDIRNAIDEVMEGRSVAFVDFPNELRALTEGGQAGDGVPLQMLAPVQSLRAKSVVMGLPGVRIEPMTSDRVRWPRIGTATVATAAEIATLTSAATNTDSVDVIAAKFGTVEYLSSELWEDYSASALATFGNNLLSWLALKVDLGLLEGDGSGPGIVGLRNTPGINTTSMAATLTLAKIRQIVYEAMVDNATPSSFVMHPRSWLTANNIVTGITSDTTTVLDAAQQGRADQLLGLPVFQSTQITLTEGTNGSWIGAIDGSQIVVCERRPARLEVSKEFKFDSDQITVRATWRGGLGVLNPEAVSILTDVRT